MIVAFEGEDRKGPLEVRTQLENPFETAGTWLRGNLHCHVGDMGDAAAVCAFYRQCGHDFLASTDYRTITPMPASTPEFATLPGAELSCPPGSHIVCVGLCDNIAPATGDPGDLRRIVDTAHAQGGVTILAHPFRTNLDWEDLVWVARSGIVGFEVSNRRSWRINGKVRSEALWEQLLKKGIYLSAIGADDSHHFEAGVSGLNFTGVLVQERTAQGILDAIRRGLTYASEGPIIRSIRVDPDAAQVVVESSPCTVCHFRTNRPLRSVHSDTPAETFTLEMRRDGNYLQDWFYVCVEDREGRRAWSSAFPVHSEVKRG